MEADRTELNNMIGENAPLEAKLLAEYSGWAEQQGVMDWNIALPTLLDKWQLDNAEG